MIRGRKTLSLLLVATLIVGLVAVVLPLCASDACAQSAPMLPVASSHMSPENLLRGDLTAACDMAVTAFTALDSVLPAVSFSVPFITALLALAAVVTLLVSRPPRDTVGVLARALSPPGDLRGVRLLI